MFLQTCRLCLLGSLLLMLRPANGDVWKGEKLEAHKNHVRSVSYSPDGKYLLSSGADNLLILWNLATGKEVRRFAAPHNMIISAVFSPDGTKVVSADHFNRILRLFNTATGVEEKSFAGHTDLVHCVAFSPNGKQLVSAGYDMTVRIWDVATEKEVHSMRGHTSQLGSAHFSPDSTMVVSSSLDNNIILWDAATGKEIRRLTGHKGSVVWAEFSPDGRTVASSSHDGSVRLWEVATGQERLNVNAHTGWARAVAFAPDGRSFASVGQDRMLQVWHPFVTGTVGTYVKHKGVVWCLSWSPDGKNVVTGGDDFQIYFTDVSRAVETAQPKPTELSDEDLGKLWTALSDDTPKAYQAIGRLISDPKKTVPFLEGNLAKAAVAAFDAKQVAKLLADLDSDDYAVREKASAGLATLGKPIEQQLRDEMAKTDSLEVTKRLRTLLATLKDVPSSDVLAIRAVETLERIGDKSAAKRSRKLPKEQRTLF